MSVMLAPKPHIITIRYTQISLCYIDVMFFNLISCLWCYLIKSVLHLRLIYPWSIYPSLFFCRCYLVFTHVRSSSSIYHDHIYVRCHLVLSSFYVHLQVKSSLHSCSCSYIVFDVIYSIFLMFSFIFIFNLILQVIWSSVYDVT